MREIRSYGSGEGPGEGNRPAYSTSHLAPAPRERNPGKRPGASSRRPPVAPLARVAGGGPSAPRQSTASARRQAS